MGGERERVRVRKKKEKRDEAGRRPRGHEIVAETGV
jgi:hypothetical protein